MSEMCSEFLWEGFSKRRCRLSATVVRNDKHYCSTHDPVLVQERKAKRDAEWKAKDKQKSEKWDREKRERDVLYDIEQMSLGKDIPEWAYYNMPGALLILKDFCISAMQYINGGKK